MALEVDDGLVHGPDGEARCWWCAGSEEYRRYHDDEWGQPIADDTRLFEKICLEGFQSGLSWITILRKRPAFRAAFADFAMETVARFGPEDVNRLLGNAAIVRHRGKIESVLNNARRALALREEAGSLAAFLWRYEPADPGPNGATRDALSGRTTVPESVALSKELRKRGWSFVGPTTLYAFMQAVGMVNDHVEGCRARSRAAEARARFMRPR